MTTAGGPGNRDSQPLGRLRRGWWNGVLAASIVVFMSVVMLNIVSTTTRIANTAGRISLIVGGVLLSLAVLGGLSFRAARLGIYEYPDGARIRGLFKTRTIPWNSIVSTHVERRRDGRGGVYYLPVLTVTALDSSMLVPVPIVRKIYLVWLCTAFEKPARRWAARVDEMVTLARTKYPQTPAR